MERLHGPGYIKNYYNIFFSFRRICLLYNFNVSCDCNSESAVRIQYLRLVHNFTDRENDFNNCQNKHDNTYEDLSGLLSTEEVLTINSILNIQL